MRHFKMNKLQVVILTMVLLLGGKVFAAAAVSLEVIAEKDIVEVNKKGKEVKRRVLAENSVPGEVLFFTIRYENTGDEAAVNVQVDNPVADGTSYKAQSAFGEASQILFSVDGGKSFKTASNLTYETKDEKGKKISREAKPEEYNAIRWVISEIPKKSKGSVGFSAVVN